MGGRAYGQTRVLQPNAPAAATGGGGQGDWSMYTPIVTLFPRQDPGEKKPHGNPMEPQNFPVDDAPFPSAPFPLAITPTP